MLRCDSTNICSARLKLSVLRTYVYKIVFQIQTGTNHYLKQHTYVHSFLLNFRYLALMIVFKPGACLVSWNHFSLHECMRVCVCVHPQGCK